MVEFFARILQFLHCGREASEFQRGWLASASVGEMCLEHGQRSLHFASRVSNSLKRKCFVRRRLFRFHVHFPVQTLPKLVTTSLTVKPEAPTANMRAGRVSMLAAL